MDGLMMDYPLLVRHIAERAETVYADREMVSRTADGIERSTYGEVATPRPPAGERPARPRHRPGRPRRHLRLELSAPPRAVPRGAVPRRRAAHAQHPPVRGRHALHRRPRRGPRDLPRRVPGRRRCRTSRASSTRSSCPTATPSARARWTTRSSSPAATRASSSPTSTRTRPRPCVTRAAPPGGPRASCTRTARPSCTR